MENEMKKDAEKKDEVKDSETAISRSDDNIRVLTTLHTDL